MKIAITGTKGAGFSLIAGLITNNVRIHPDFGTCHQSWEFPISKNEHTVSVTHEHDLDTIKKICDPNVIIGIWINPKNLIQICNRLVFTDFQFAPDTTWKMNHWAWHKEKHDILAGPDWPPFSENIADYPQWCLNELCQVAYDRSRYWLDKNMPYDFIIDSDELFGTAAPASLNKIFTYLNVTLDLDTLNQWKNKNREIYQHYQQLFSWYPGWTKDNE